MTPKKKVSINRVRWNQSTVHLFLSQLILFVAAFPLQWQLWVAAVDTRWFRESKKKKKKIPMSPFAPSPVSEFSLSGLLLYVFTMVLVVAVLRSPVGLSLEMGGLSLSSEGWSDPWWSGCFT